ncbi:hypothetical protein DY000_02015997 [Brassica cretica]|uniref:Uncharacterized protein n=1 Tax=Brassica cretica TaxID=69181 RepID=A0ABQ7D536_BRACR|nr:hypothetical protein DY000_02015997 [Brassica cretica]
MLKQILESQTRSEKHIGYKLKNLHTKVDGSYNDLNNNFLYGTKFVSQAAAQIVDKTKHKAMERVKAQAELKILESQTRCEKHIGYELKNLHTKVDGSYNDLNNNFSYGTEFVSQAAGQIVDKTEHKAMERVKAHAELKVAAENLKSDEHKAENQVEREVVHRLKEVKLKGTTEVEQSPYDKLPFPQRVLTKA